MLPILAGLYVSDIYLNAIHLLLNRFYVRSPVNLGQACNINISSELTPEEGLWTLLAVDFLHLRSDHLQMGPAELGKHLVKL